MKIKNGLEETTAFNGGYVDLVCTHPDVLHNGRLIRKLYRGKIGRILWRPNFPRLDLIQVKEFREKTAKWVNCKQQEIRLNWPVSTKNPIRPGTFSLTSGRVLFVVPGITGVMIPRTSRLPRKHSFTKI